MKTVQTEIPEELYRKAESLIREGWFQDEGELVSEFYGVSWTAIALS